MRKSVIGAVAMVVLVVIGGFRAANLVWSRDGRLATAEARASNLAQILSEYVAGAVAEADAALRQLTINGRRIGGPSAPADEWTTSLATAHAGLRGVAVISVLDRDGVIRHSTRPDIVGQSRADDVVVRQALNAVSDELVVGAPVRADVEPHDSFIPIARRLTTSKGEAQGAVVAVFIAAELRPFFQNVNVGERGVVWVFHPDGTVLFRKSSAGLPTVIAESALANPIFVAARAGNPRLVREPIEPGGGVMLSAHATGPAPHLMVAVSLDRDEALADWRREAVTTALLAGLAASILALTLFVLFRQIDANAAAEAALERSRQREAEGLRDANERLAATLEREQAARREAETASALKDQFLMTISHELRTPLTAIAGWARLLVDGMVGDERREEALKAIERNARAQTRLIEDLLDVSGIMSGKLRLRVQTVRMADIVHTATNAIAPAAAAKAIQLEVTIDPDVAVVTGDPDRLQQVVWNLLSNAVKFTPREGRVHLGVSRNDEGVEMTVADTGAGIAPEFLPFVFDRFRQGEVGPSRKHGGLGLGLSIVRSLVELHGGTVVAESDGVNRGAVFTVRLPARVSHAQTAVAIE